MAHGVFIFILCSVCVNCWCDRANTRRAVQRITHKLYIEECECAKCWNRSIRHIGHKIASHKRQLSTGAHIVAETFRNTQHIISIASIAATSPPSSSSSSPAAVLPLPLSLRHNGLVDARSADRFRMVPAQDQPAAAASRRPFGHRRDSAPDARAHAVLGRSVPRAE